jgi:hypothetical protein
LWSGLCGGCGCGLCGVWGVGVWCVGDGAGEAATIAVGEARRQDWVLGPGRCLLPDVRVRAPCFCCPDVCDHFACRRTAQHSSRPSHGASHCPGRGGLPIQEGGGCSVCVVCAVLPRGELVPGLWGCGSVVGPLFMFHLTCMLAARAHTAQYFMQWLRTVWSLPLPLLLHFLLLMLSLLLQNAVGGGLPLFAVVGTSWRAPPWTPPAMSAAPTSGLRGSAWPSGPGPCPPWLAPRQPPP